MVSDLVFCSSWQEGFGWFWRGSQSTQNFCAGSSADPEIKTPGFSRHLMLHFKWSCNVRSIRLDSFSCENRCKHELN